jgi:hypothetical protein
MLRRDSSTVVDDGQVVAPKAPLLETASGSVDSAIERERSKDDTTTTNGDDLGVRSPSLLLASCL